MTDTEILESLRKADIFHDIGDEHLKHLAKIARFVEFPAHHEMFHERDPAKDVFVVVSGRVSLIICLPDVGCRELAKIGPGELIALSPLVGRTRLLDTARTIEATTALAIDGEKALTLCREDTEFGFEFMHRVANGLAKRLSDTRLQFLEMAGFHLPQVQLESD